MRGTVAKELRAKAREIAKDQPTKLMGRVQKWFKRDGKDVPGRVQAVNTGYRAVYQSLKKEYKVAA